MPFDMNKSRQFWKIQRYNEQIDWVQERGRTFAGYMEFYKGKRCGQRMSSGELYAYVLGIWNSDMKALLQYRHDLPDFR